MKRDWELSRLIEMAEEDELKAEVDEDEMLYTAPNELLSQVPGTRRLRLRRPFRSFRGRGRGRVRRSAFSPTPAPGEEGSIPAPRPRRNPPRHQSLSQAGSAAINARVR